MKILSTKSTKAFDDSYRRDVWYIPTPVSPTTLLPSSALVIIKSSSISEISTAMFVNLHYDNVQQPRTRQISRYDNTNEMLDDSQQGVLFNFKI